MCLFGNKSDGQLWSVLFNQGKSIRGSLPGQYLSRNTGLVLFALQQRLLFDLVQAIHETGLALQRLHAVEKYHSVISKDTGCVLNEKGIEKIICRIDPFLCMGVCQTCVI